jgi:hypothetical protein
MPGDLHRTGSRLSKNPPHFPMLRVETKVTRSPKNCESGGDISFLDTPAAQW